jgi:hypothetical protein
MEPKEQIQYTETIEAIKNTDILISKLPAVPINPDISGL